MTKYHKLGGLNNRNVSSHSSGGEKPEINVLKGPWALWNPLGNLSELLPSFWWQSLHFLAWCCITPTSACIITWCFPCSSVFMRLSYKDTTHIVLGTTLLQYDLILTNYICNNHSSKWSYVRRHWELRLQHIFWGWHFNPSHSLN